jgi:hypothetical protein
MSLKYEHETGIGVGEEKRKRAEKRAVGTCGEVRECVSSGEVRECINS